MNTKTNHNIMTAKQARETTHFSDKTLDFMDRLRGKIKEEIDRRTSKGYLNGGVTILIKNTEVNYVGAVEEIIKELEKLGYNAALNWRDDIVTGRRKGIHLYFNWKE